MKEAEAALLRNGYDVVSKDTAQGLLVARDSVEKVKYPYTALIRYWNIHHTGDSIMVEVQSVNVRLDDSEVVQTWDKKWSDEIVKEWMRPIMTSLETACGLGSPLRPR
jgi:hypothetical protein